MMARQAIEAGATPEEITEALRVAQYLSGVGSIYTAGQALKELFEERPALDTEKVEKNLPEFIIAVIDGITVGCACLDVGDIVELRSIAILPSYRNKGIGSELANVVLNRAAEL